MPISDDISTRITSLQQELSALQLELQDAIADEQSKLPEWKVRFATFLHFNLCDKTHPDDCDWYEETWDGIKPDRDVYLTLAQNLKDELTALLNAEEGFEYDDVIEIIFRWTHPDRNTPDERARYDTELATDMTNYYGV